MHWPIIVWEFKALECLHEKNLKKSISVVTSLANNFFFGLALFLLHSEFPGSDSEITCFRLEILSQFSSAQFAQDSSDHNDQVGIQSSLDDMCKV